MVNSMRPMQLKMRKVYQN